MLQENTNRMYLALENQLEQVAMNGDNNLLKMVSALGLVRAKLKELETYVLEHPLRDGQEEILYYKEIHPRFYHLLIYYVECFNLEMSVPAAGDAAIVAWYREELKYIGRFFQQNQFYYRCYQAGTTELDELYFTRKRAPQSILLPENAGPGGATNLSYLFAKIIAYEKLKAYINDKLNPLTPGESGSSHSPSKHKLKWTGDSINLVELAYGLWLTGQLNNGNAGLNEIVRWLEDTFEAGIGRISRRFTEISRRKRLTYAKFMEQMAAAINKKIGDADAK